jgi:hypothetical protein
MAAPVTPAPMIATSYIIYPRPGLRKSEFDAMLGIILADTIYDLLSMEFSFHFTIQMELPQREFLGCRFRGFHGWIK